LLDLATVPIPLRLPALSGTSGTRGAVSVDERLAPLAYIIPGQLFALHLALHKGLNPDQPRGLTKVTYTR
jgi:glucosamine 6-phosphate synthetase-like amidotransferase/phosphosugar isomerase protein